MKLNELEVLGDIEDPCWGHLNHWVSWHCGREHWFLKTSGIATSSRLFSKSRGVPSQHRGQSCRHCMTFHGLTSSIFGRPRHTCHRVPQSTSSSSYTSSKPGCPFTLLQTLSQSPFLWTMASTSTIGSCQTLAQNNALADPRSP